MASDRAKAIQEEKARQAREDRLARIEDNQKLIMAALKIVPSDVKSPTKATTKKPAAKK